MSNLKYGKVYKIIHNQSDIIYIGSTFNTLRDRLYRHNNAYNKSLNNKHSNISIYKYFEQYGVNNFKIILIKEYEVVDRKHLQSKEQLWINITKCINKNSAFRINYLSKKEYYEKNKVLISEKGKTYYENNKNKIKESNKEYCKNNKDKTKQLKKNHYKKNKEQISEKNKEKIKCEVCNYFITKCNINRHEQTKKHLKALN